jgi:hypothetical protein
MIDPYLERQDSLHSRRSTWGFGLSSLGLALLCFDSGLELGYILSFAPELRKLLLHPIWRLGIGGLITALTCLGSYLLWMRGDSRAWARASTLLLLMNLGHVAFWLIENHAELGLPDQRIAHRWMRLQASQIMNWAEFLCWISLLRDLNRHTDVSGNEAVARFRVYSGFALLGSFVALAVGIGLTDWSAGWPLRRVVWLGPLDSLMLATLTTMLTFAASLQLSLHCLQGARLSALVARDQAASRPDDQNWTQDHWDDDPWGTRGGTADLPAG